MFSQIVGSDIGKLKPPAFSFRSLLSKDDWKTLSRCRRLYAAMLLEQLLAGRPLDLLSKEFNVAAADIDALRFNARIMASKVHKLCSEVGYDKSYLLSL